MLNILGMTCKGLVVHLPLFFLATGCLLWAEPELLPAHQMRARLKNAEGLCLVPDKAKPIQVVAVPCSDDERQFWLFNKKTRVLKSQSPSPLEFHIPSGHDYLPQRPGMKQRGPHSQVSEGAEVIADLEAIKRPVLSIPLSAVRKRVALGQRFILEPGEQVSFQIGRSPYTLAWIKVADERCPRGAYCLLHKPARLTFAMGPQRYLGPESKLVCSQVGAVRCADVDYYNDATEPAVARLPSSFSSF